MRARHLQGSLATGALSLLLIGAASCGGGSTTPGSVAGPGAAAGLRIEPGSTSLMLGAIARLSAVETDASGRTIGPAQATWASSDPSVASVSPDGLVTGASAGSATITAKAASGSAAATVTVEAASGALSLDFATLLGGVNNDVVRDIAVDPQGNIYVTGGTASPNFPVTPGSFDQTFNSTAPDLHDVFVTKLDPAGNIVWSTFIGGPGYDRAYGIELDDRGFIYVAGRAGAGFPVTSGAFQTAFRGGSFPGPYGEQDGFVCKVTPDGSSLVFCSYFGTTDGSIVRDLDVDANGDVYIASSVRTGSFPSGWFRGGFQPARAAGIDGIAAKIATDGSRVLWATFLAGSGDESQQPSIRVDDGGHAYMTMATTSPDMPTPGGFDGRYNGGSDMWLGELSADGGSLVFGTYIGGSGKEFTETHELALDRLGNIYVATTTLSTDFPTTTGAFQRVFGGIGGAGQGAGTNYSGDLFVTKIAPGGSPLLHSTYVGGSFGEGGEGVGNGPDGSVFVAGATRSVDFPISSVARQGFGGQLDAVAARLDGELGQLLYSTYYGGSSTDAARTATVGPDGSYLFGGGTRSTDWPAVHAAQSTPGGARDGFVVKLRPAN
ncbi:MAG: SBBP repeat-containing protein [Gemmatimonadota bacterium]